MRQVSEDIHLSNSKLYLTTSVANGEVINKSEACTQHLLIIITVDTLLDQ